MDNRLRLNRTLLAVLCPTFGLNGAAAQESYAVTWALEATAEY